MQTFMDVFRKERIVPVVKLTSESQALPTAQALVAGGIHSIEVTFRSDAAAASIGIIAKKVPDINVCAGTVLTVEDAKKALEAGAKAIISPGTSDQVIDWCQKNNISVIPGCATATEIQHCIERGIDFVKLFPAEVVGGVSMLKSLQGPYAAMQFMPTGGITLQNVNSYLVLDNVVACGSSQIVPQAMLQKKEYSQIESLAKEAASAVQGVVSE